MVGSGVVTGMVVPNGAPTMVDVYEGRLDAEFGAVDGVIDDDEVVVGGVVGVVPTVICACADGAHDSNTHPTTGYQISSERRELIVMGASGHPGTGPMVG